MPVTARWTALAIAVLVGIAACSSTPPSPPPTPRPVVKYSPSPTGITYRSPYPDIPLTGPPLTPEQTAAVNAMAKLDSAKKSLWERKTSDYSLLKTLTSPRLAQLIEDDAPSPHLDDWISTGWLTTIIRYVEIDNTRATIASCVDNSTHKYTDKSRSSTENPINLRITYLQKNGNTWIVLGDTYQAGYSDDDPLGWASTKDYTKCLAAFGRS